VQSKSGGGGEAIKSDKFYFLCNAQKANPMMSRQLIAKGDASCRRVAAEKRLITLKLS